MDEKTINNIKWKADEMIWFAESEEKKGDKETAEWHKGFAVGMMRALNMAGVISADEYVDYFKKSEIL